MGKVLLVLALILLGYGITGTALADDPLVSPNYVIPESYIGPGGDINSSSPNYSSTGTIGDTATGQSTSPNYGTQAGYNTTSDPRLSVVINTSSIAFGSLSTAATSTATATFSVLNYTAYGYAVYTIGSPPSNEGHSLTGMNPTTASQTGTEQYGINLKANTSPVSFGADPAQVPSSSFSYGTAASGYNTTNNYRYVAGEKIAEATKTSGETDYTISYIVNVSTTTPGGQYAGSQSLVVVGTY